VGKWLFCVRVEIDGNIFDGLRRGRREFPPLDGGYSTFGEDRITARNGNVTYGAIDKHGGLQPNHATYLSSLQKFRI